MKCISYTGLILLFFVWSSYLLAGSIYYYEDQNGVLHFTDFPKSKKYKPYFYVKNPKIYSKKKILVLVKKYSKQYGLEPELVQAVLEVESDYHVKALSNKGAQGLMQIMPETQRELGLTRPYDPACNIEAGVRYLKRMFKRFSNLKLVVAAYNAGPSKVDYYQAVPPYGETGLYVKKVLALYNSLKSRVSNVQSSK